MKVSKVTIAMAVIIMIMAFFGGQLTGYLNRRVAEGTPVSEICHNMRFYIHEWIDDTDGRWVW